MKETLQLWTRRLRAEGVGAAHVGRRANTRVCREHLNTGSSLTPPPPLAQCSAPIPRSATKQHSLRRPHSRPWERGQRGGDTHHSPYPTPPPGSAPTRCAHSSPTPPPDISTAHLTHTCWAPPDPSMPGGTREPPTHAGRFPTPPHHPFQRPTAPQGRAGQPVWLRGSQLLPPHHAANPPPAKPGRSNANTSHPAAPAAAHGPRPSPPLPCKAGRGAQHCWEGKDAAPNPPPPTGSCHVPGVLRPLCAGLGARRDGRGEQLSCF